MTTRDNDSCPRGERVPESLTIELQMSAFKSVMIEKMIGDRNDR
jgi:hypothetical protein